MKFSKTESLVLRRVTFCSAVIGVLGIGISFATPIDTSWIANGQQLSASNLAANLTSLQDQITALQGQVTAADARLTALEAAKLPAGTVSAFAGPVVPTGWLLCDGSDVPRSSFPALFAAIGTAHGSGDGATTFSLPDYRGRFLRGVDLGTAMRDPDRAIRTASKAGGNVGNLVGSVQTEQYKGHSHNVQDSGHSHSTNLNNCSGANLSSGAVLYAVSNFPCAGPTTTSTSSANLTQTQGGGGNETRPQNAYVNYIIKI
jgi:microcystin-dependent protein